MYASARDDAFVLGPLGGTSQGGAGLRLLRPRVQVVPVVGEIVADLLQTWTTLHDIALFDVAPPAFAGTRTN